MVFTASHACYANVVINHIDPKGYFFTHRFFREHCHKTEEGMYVKDLRVINRDLSRVLLIDNAAYSYAFQPENGVPILPFYDNQADTELKSLTTYLKQMFGVPDVRKKNDTMFKLSQYCRYSNATELLNSLYP
jgi:CTD small phosphatase-like protein 2